MNTQCVRSISRLARHSTTYRVIQIVFFALILMQVGGCASSSSVTEGDTKVRSPIDPWEPLNRVTYAFNDGLDTVTLRPISKGYKKIVPGFVRRGISNFFANLRTPLIIVNNLLQGKGRDALSDTGRLLVNSTVGIGGLIDLATPAGLEEHDEDFGQTLAKWGVPDGPFLMVPFLGPRTLKDAITIPLNFFFDPLFYYENSSVRDKVWIIQAIHLRSKLLAAERTIESSYDPYIMVREAYLQNRAYLIYDGDPPKGDDDLFEEFLKEE